MRVKRKLNLQVVDQIKGHTSVELIERCPDQRQVFPTSPCSNGACEFAIRQCGYMNCSFVAAEAGGHTLEAIGEMMGITREGVRLIERRAKQKFRAAWDELAKINETSIQESLVAAGGGYVEADVCLPELEDETYEFPAHYCGELA